VARYLARAFSVRSADGRHRLTALDLEDAHQETFVRAFADRQRSTYDGLRPFEGYLFTIARSAAIDVLRRHGKVARESVAVEDPADPALGVDELSPEERTLKAELQQVVRAFLATLVPEERQLAELRFAEGLSQEQAAARLSLTRSEVRTREKRVREALAAHLSRTGWPAGLVAALLAALGGPHGLA
jgi:RNA polymerase sigma-70 factor (ECF subfamily)